MNSLGLFITGAAGYGIIEVLWRGYTHPTMLLLGGICFLLILYVKNHFVCSFLAKCLLCSAAITSAEFIFGVVFNILLKWNVWDYTNQPYNILGQICPVYSLYWAIISAGVMLIF